MYYDSISASIRGTQAKKSGKQNEDRFIADDRRGIYIIADGLGGHAGGSTASTIAVSIVHQELTEFYSILRKNPSLKEEIPLILEQILQLTDEIISIGGSAKSINPLLKHSPNTEQLRAYPLLEHYLDSMGTTIDACFIHDDVAYLGHVGNGRIYKMEGNLIRKITREHVMSTIPEKTMSHDGWVLHERTLGLTNYLGMRGEPADIHTEEMRQGDRLVLLTDGFSHALSLSELISALGTWENATMAMKRHASKPEEIPKLYSAKMGLPLKEAKRIYNGMDNATFIAIRRSF